MKVDSHLPSEMVNPLQGSVEGGRGGILQQDLSNHSFLPRAGELAAEHVRCDSPATKRVAILGTWSTPTCVLEPSAFSSPAP